MEVPALAAFNLVDEVMCATLHNHLPVKKGEKVAATRAIPLIMKRAAIERAAAIAVQTAGWSPWLLSAGTGRPDYYRQRSLSRPDPGPLRPDS